MEGLRPNLRVSHLRELDDGTLQEMSPTTIFCQELHTLYHTLCIARKRTTKGPLENGKQLWPISGNLLPASLRRHHIRNL